MSNFTACRKTLKVRPSSNNATHPEQTDEKYCVYDELSHSYGYTPAFVNRLVRDCSTPEGFRALTGRTARPKPSAAVSLGEPA